MKITIGSLDEKQLSGPPRISKYACDASSAIDVDAPSITRYGIALPEYGIWLCFQDDSDRIKDLTGEIWSMSPEEIKQLAKTRADMTGPWRQR